MLHIGIERDKTQLHTTIHWMHSTTSLAGPQLLLLPSRSELAGLDELLDHVAQGDARPVPAEH